MITLTILSDASLAHAVKRLAALNENLPLTLIIKKYRKHHSNQQLKLLGAMLRDIARWKYVVDVVPEHLYNRVLEDFRRTDIWPSYDNPEPDVFTGEVLYRKKSRRDLNIDEIKGIVQWLEHFMVEHGVISHAPVDNWQE